VKQYTIDLETSLKYQENGRLKPATNKEYAKSVLKKVICPNCKFEKEVSKIIFGEELRCPKCKTVMLEQY